MSEANKALLRRWAEESHNKQNMALVDELFDADFLYREPSLGELKGREAFRQLVRSVWAAFPDGKYTIEDLAAEGDKVVVRWRYAGTHQGEFMGVAPTGKRVTMAGIVILRVADGKFVECWENIDALGLLRQLGAAPEATEANKTLLRRYFDEILNQRNPALVDDVFADDSVMRVVQVPEGRGWDARKQLIAAIHRSSADGRYTIEDLIAEGDEVVARWTWTGTHDGEWMGIAPTGRRVSLRGTTTVRVAGGKIVEDYTDWDALGNLQQLGLAPPLGAAKAQSAG